MRSRYTAYVVRDEDHLFRTWHPATRPERVEADASLTWTGLDVLSATEGESEGTVEFAAHWRSGEGAVRQDGVVREVSTFARRAVDFARERGHHVYLMPVRTSVADYLDVLL